MQALLAERDAAVEAGGDGGAPRGGGRLRALVLAPTRELAVQVAAHLAAVARPVGVRVVAVVGGLAPQKQARELAARPPVVVATPGRLWDLMRSGEAHLADLSALSFLVVDEADRMVQQGQHGELAQVVDAVRAARASAAGRDAAQKEAAGAAEGADEEVEEEEGADDAPAATAATMRTSARALQTLVFSATLTLPAELRRRLRRGGGGASGTAAVDALMDRLPFRPGRPGPKIVDLTSEHRLAERVAEACVHCAEPERDARLYALLAAHPGRAAVFVNAVSAARRLAALLKLLGLPAAPLHAGMQQRARLKALDRFKVRAMVPLSSTFLLSSSLMPPSSTVPLSHTF